MTALHYQPLLKVENLVKHYGGRRGPMDWIAGRPSIDIRAVNGVSFTVYRGETLGLIGESGCGKSTLGRALLRLHEPTAGRVEFDGVDVTALAPHELKAMRRHMQIIFQDPYASLNPRRTVADIIGLPLMIHGIAENRADMRERVATVMDLVGLKRNHLDRYPHQFSGGQRQRLCIARALALEPDVLVADEAVSALDVSVQAQVLALLDDIREKTGVGVLFITHDLRVAAQICDTIMVMQNGRMVEFGAAADVLTAPREAYTRALLDAAPGRHWDFQHFRPL